MGRKTQQLMFGRRCIEISKLDKVLYPGTKFYERRPDWLLHRMAKYILPHLKDRADAV